MKNEVFEGRLEKMSKLSPFLAILTDFSPKLADSLLDFTSTPKIPIKNERLQSFTNKIRRNTEKYVTCLNI